MASTRKKMTNGALTLALFIATSSPCYAAFVPGGVVLSSTSPTLSRTASFPSGGRRGARITATKMTQASEEEDGDIQSASLGRRLFVCGSGAALAVATMASPHLACATSDSTVSKVVFCPTPHFRIPATTQPKMKDLIPFRQAFWSEIARLLTSVASPQQFSLQAPPTDKDPLGNKDPFIKFEDGVSYKEYKAGAGDLVVGPGRTVSAQVTVQETIHAQLFVLGATHVFM